MDVLTVLVVSIVLVSIPVGFKLAVDLGVVTRLAAVVVAVVLVVVSATCFRMPVDVVGEVTFFVSTTTVFVEVGILLPVDLLVVTVVVVVRPPLVTLVGDLLIVPVPLESSNSCSRRRNSATDSSPWSALTVLLASLIFFLGGDGAGEGTGELLPLARRGMLLDDGVLTAGSVVLLFSVTVVVVVVVLLGADLLIPPRPVRLVDVVVVEVVVADLRICPESARFLTGVADDLLLLVAESEGVRLTACCGGGGDGLLVVSGSCPSKESASDASSCYNKIDNPAAAIYWQIICDDRITYFINRSCLKGPLGRESFLNDGDVTIGRSHPRGPPECSINGRRYGSWASTSDTVLFFDIVDDFVFVLFQDGAIGQPLADRLGERHPLCDGRPCLSRLANSAPRLADFHRADDVSFSPLTDGRAAFDFLVAAGIVLLILLYHLVVVILRGCRRPSRHVTLSLEMGNGKKKVNVPSAVRDVIAGRRNNHGDDGLRAIAAAGRCCRRGEDELAAERIGRHGYIRRGLDGGRGGCGALDLIEHLL